MNNRKSFLVAIKKLFQKFGIRVIRENAFLQIIEELTYLASHRFQESRNGFLFKFLAITENPRKVLENMHHSKSQIMQDIFVLEKLNWKQRGFFVEIGATNGIDLSNTYLLETQYMWEGILAEPARNWHSNLFSNRRAFISDKCVWNIDGEMIKFNESIFPEFSTVNHLTNFDGMAQSRQSQDSYLVESITLLTLLKNAEAPKYIDYISIDTEGSEFEILNSFDFTKYEFGILTVEHNHNANEALIDQLLLRNGYVRVHREISEFDGWYVNKSLQGS